jgi:NAD(P)H-dependent flavin oxidoreductase YrpB (nitropropane dioxygenase family)
MQNRVAELLRCDLPIQLAPMGSVSATPALPLAVAEGGGHGMYPALVLATPVLAPVLDALSERTAAFGVNLRHSIAAAQALDEGACASLIRRDGERPDTHYTAAPRRDPRADVPALGLPLTRPD